jgi:putative tricarboxylic transport membrane protein
MYDMLEGLLLALSPQGILYMIAGGVIGLIIGILPGLGPVFGVALLLPSTFWMPAHLGLIFLGSLYGCCVYGGSITAVLLGIPGTPGSITTVFDGHEIAKKGEAGVALGLSATASMLGGIIGVMSLAIFGPILAELAVKLAPADYFALAVFGLSMVAVAAKGDTLKGLMLATLGVALSTVGQDLFTGEHRFAFGSEYLIGGIPFIPAMIGLFALSQAFIIAEEGGKISKIGKVTGDFWEGVTYTFKHWGVVVKNAILGVILGIIPGVGINVTGFMAYLGQKRVSKDPDSFGKGNPLGVIAPESGNNACVSGELIPAFGLGIPGASTAAIFIGAITMYGLRPGYAFFSESGPIAWALITGLLFSQFLFFIIGAFGANYVSKVTLVPAGLMVPAITTLSFIGGISYRHFFGDAILVLVSGIVGYVLHRYRYPIACLVLGMILGKLVERNFFRAMQISDNVFDVFIYSPITIIFWSITILVLAFGLFPLKEWLKKLMPSKSE